MTTYTIRQPRELAALASARKQEIVDVLAGMGDVSVAELAAALGRPADRLYFHLRALKRVGLVQSAGWRYHGRRREALVRTIAPELRLRYEPRDGTRGDALAAIVASMFRLGVRDFRHALRVPDVAVSGGRRELWALRRTGRLRPSQLAGVNRAIAKLVRALPEPRGQGRLYAITVLFTPLDRGRTHHKKGRTR